ncbi:MAG: helix-turn-helix domain-containing protein [Pseudomonadota bacterium]
MLFRERLSAAMALRTANQSALARAIGVDRSTISQLLAGGATRLPNAQIVAECAAELGVSADWLLGLSNRPEQADALLAASIEMSPAERAHVDEQIYHWHQEAQGYKIRHVPSNLPDLLKTEDFLRWEYRIHLGRTSDEAVAAAHDRLDVLRRSGTDYEVAMPLFELASFIGRTGYYEGLPEDVRNEQVARIKDLHDQLYPSLRVFVFDARELYSAPITVFGPLLAVIYLGQNYMCFRDTERVTALSRHFDRLVREARISARDLPVHLDELLETLG